MSLALQTWFTNYQNQWVHHYRHDLQTTKINESRPSDVIHRWPKSMSPALQMWFTDDQNQWVQASRCDLQMTKSMSPALETWFTNYQNQWVHNYRPNYQNESRPSDWFTVTKINESSPPDVIHRWPKSMNETWFTRSKSPDVIHRWPKSMSPALQMWFTDHQNQWVQASRHDLQVTKINESSTRDMIYKLKSMSPALQT